MSSGIMPPISLVLTQEERRNLVLRVRYGHHGQKVRPEPKGALLVVGQSVAQGTKPLTAPPLSRFLSKSHPELVTKAYLNPMPNSAKNTNTSVSSPSVLPKDSTGPFGLSHASPETVAPPTTPHGVTPASGLYDPSAFRDNGDVKAKSPLLKALLKDGAAATTSAPHGDFGEVSKPLSGQSVRKSSDRSMQCDKTFTKSIHQDTADGAPFSITDLPGRKAITTSSPPGSRRIQKSQRSRTDEQLHGVAEGGPPAVAPIYIRSSQDGGNEAELHQRTKHTSGVSRRSSLAMAQQQQKTSPPASRSGEERRTSFGKPPGAVTRAQPGRRASNGGAKTKGGATKRRTSKTQDGIREEVAAQKDEESDVTVFRKFREMPKSRPKTICFDYPGTQLTHVDVKNAIQRTVPDAFEADRVTSVQFENVNVKLGTGGLPNRWLIELKDFTTRNKLIKGGLTIVVNETQDPLLSDASPRSVDHVTPKLYDMVAMEEYKLFLRKTAAEEKLQTLILLNAGRGQSLLANML